MNSKIMTDFFLAFYTVYEKVQLFLQTYLLTCLKTKIHQFC